MLPSEIAGQLQPRVDLIQKYGIKSLAVFGSMVRGEADRNSDIDLLVEFIPNTHIGLLRFLELRDELSDLLGRRVDLVTRDALHPALSRKILEEAVDVA